MRALILVAGAWIAGLAPPVGAAPVGELAAKFGAREAFDGVAISPDGTHVSYLNPIRGTGTALVVVDLATGQAKPVMTVSSADYQIRSCGWIKRDRLACRVRVEHERRDFTAAATTTITVDPDGGNRIEIGDSVGSSRSNGGRIIDSLPDHPDNILMTTWGYGGLTVQRVNARTGKAQPTKDAWGDAAMVLTDLQGRIRLKANVRVLETASYGYYVDRRYRYAYRPKNGTEWRTLAVADLGANITVEVDGFDESGDWIYLLKPHEGRQALFLVAADDSGRSELIFAHPQVDVSGVKRIGKTGRPIGATYSTDYEHVEYFDPTLKKLSEGLRKVLPGQPTVTIVDESWDGEKLLVHAGSDVEPGAYYVYTKATRRLGKLSAVRPELEGMTLAAMKPISYAARDGTSIPGYLTLPPGKLASKLPAIIMPHGGPASRDIWGFDWIAQYFAQLGYAVLQPNYRGSAGYGDAWYEQNGFKSWPTAIGDINDGARWLVSQGVADGTRLAIFGWSYGGYAALQANVADADLYKATIAVAPVTDLVALKAEARKYNVRLTQDFIGAGPHVEEGSPARNAARIKTPILMFHGTRDLNVDIDQSRLMAKALKAAQKPHELIVYDGLEHSLVDNEARTDLLKRSADFLAANLD
ncbi:MAG: alpha/beta fold hydrolase [Sphingomonadaceae bacterium]|nr:alpha/beta fold hydrolase [Sphingomonadaceae bacterium]